MRYKNIFVLCTGRSGSFTFISACKHITNYTAGHETLSSELGETRFNYPDFHIEGDNRLSWFTGKLHECFDSETTLYVHLIRNKEDTVNSYNRRWNSHNSIMKAFAEGILKIPLVKLQKSKRKQVAEDYYETVNSNIRLFLHNKPNTITISFESITSKFEEFWKLIDAEGSLEDAIQELNIKHNKSRGTNANDILYSLKLFLLRFKFW